MSDPPTHVRVDGHEIKITNLDKVLYPKTGTTKGEVLNYYARIAPLLIKYAHDRPATRTRWPDGVEAESFFEKNLPKHTPEWVPRAKIAHSDRDVYYPLINNTATLMWLVQGAALELHIPQWTYGTKSKKQWRADRLVIDLDPGPPAGLAECCEVAVIARDLLSDEGLELFPVSSGSKGMQLYASVEDHPEITNTNEYAKAFAQRLAELMPNKVIAHMTRADREGIVFLDWSQNNGAKTTIAPYSMRGREDPNVAAPRTWDEVESGDIEQLRFDSVLERIESIGDVFGLQ